MLLKASRNFQATYFDVTFEQENESFNSDDIYGAMLKLLLRDNKEYNVRGTMKTKLIGCIVTKF